MIFVISFYYSKISAWQINQSGSRLLIKNHELSVALGFCHIMKALVSSSHHSSCALWQVQSMAAESYEERPAQQLRDHQ